MSKLFTIFGATGQQGGALIRYLLKHPEFSSTYRLRGITRDDSKPASVELKSKGVEVVEANMDDTQSLRKAMEGSHTVFTMTNWLETASPAKEIVQGKALADAAVEAKVKLYIWSSLPRTGIPHFNSKADVEDYIRSLPLNSAFFMPGWFMQNFLAVVKPKKQPNGSYTLAKLFPTATADTLLPLIDIEDTGKYLSPVLQQPQKYAGTRLFASTALYSIAEICETWTKVTGHQVVFDGAEDAVQNSNTLTAAQKEVLVKNREESSSGYYGPEGVEGLKGTVAQVEEPLTTWEEFVKANEPWFD